MVAQFFDKFPAEIIDFQIDCTAALPGVDTIVALTGATVSSGDLTILNSGGTVTTIDGTGKYVTFWCTGGTPGAIAKVVCQIITNGGRLRQTEVFILIKSL